MQARCGRLPDDGGAPFRADMCARPDGSLEIVLAGELDHQSAETLDRMLQQAIESGVGDVAVNASLLTFCDAGGLTCFLTARKRLIDRGRRLRLVDPTPLVARVLILARVEFLME
jgi:anti-anti-sigma factor